MTENFDWKVEPLTFEDQKLVDAYLQTGLSLDELAYTEAFEKLVKDVGFSDNLSEKHTLFKRLLTLRKKGQLPRLSGVGS